jgi:nitroimidazol reductase NimA-like FMN-containing flavoprotein (pyridoxamine 5'-phosphate oxidase superfamily)
MERTGQEMNDALKTQILSIMDEHRIMTVATLRSDGWPQATTVGYAHEGLTLYFLCGHESQKARNLAFDPRVSITIDHDEPQVMKITGLSMAGQASRIRDKKEAERVMALLIARYPQQAETPGDLPPASAVAIFKVTPAVISVLDYSKGFGHAELTRVE